MRTPFTEHLKLLDGKLDDADFQVLKSAANLVEFRQLLSEHRITDSSSRVALWEVRDALPTDFLVDLIRSPIDSYVARECALSILIQREAECVSDVLHAIQGEVKVASEDSTNYLVSLIFSLRILGDKSCCEELFMQCRNENPLIRAASAELIGDLSCSLPHDLAKSLLTDLDPNVRYYAIASMGLLGMKDMAEDLKPLVHDANRESVFGRSVGEAARNALRAIADTNSDSSESRSMQIYRKISG